MPLGEKFDPNDMKNYDLLDYKGLTDSKDKQAVYDKEGKILKDGVTTHIAYHVRVPPEYKATRVQGEMLIADKPAQRIFDVTHGGSWDDMTKQANLLYTYPPIVGSIDLPFIGTRAVTTQTSDMIYAGRVPLCTVRTQRIARGIRDRFRRLVRKNVA